MDKQHEYVPAQQVIESFDVFGDGGTIEMNEYIYHQILLGSDQLTVAHARSSAAIHADHITRVCSRQDPLEGLYCLLLKIGMLSNAY